MEFDPVSLRDELIQRLRTAEHITVLSGTAVGVGQRHFDQMRIQHAHNILQIRHVFMPSIAGTGWT